MLTPTTLSTKTIHHQRSHRRAVQPARCEWLPGEFCNSYREAFNRVAVFGGVRDPVERAQARSPRGPAERAATLRASKHASTRCLRARQAIAHAARDQRLEATGNEFLPGRLSDIQTRAAQAERWSEWLGLGHDRVQDFEAIKPRRLWLLEDRVN